MVFLLILLILIGSLKALWQLSRSNKAVSAAWQAEPIENRKFSMGEVNMLKLVGKHAAQAGDVTELLGLTQDLAFAIWRLMI